MGLSTQEEPGVRGAVKSSTIDVSNNQTHYCDRNETVPEPRAVDKAKSVSQTFARYKFFSLKPLPNTVKKIQNSTPMLTREVRVTCSTYRTSIFNRVPLSASNL